MGQCYGKRCDPPKLGGIRSMALTIAIPRYSRSALESSVYRLESVQSV